MKTCHACKHVRRTFTATYCVHPDRSTADLVTGECYALVEREHGACGIPGTNWMPRNLSVLEWLLDRKLPQ